MGKAEENKLEKKQRLLDTAFNLFVSKGIIHTSISDIAHHSGVAKGTFYLYFQDKYDLQDYLITTKAKQLFDHALQHSGYEEKDDPADKIIAIFDDVLSEMQKDSNLLRFINKNLSWGIFRRALDHDSNNLLEFFEDILHVYDRKTMEIMVYSGVELVGSTCFSVILDNDPVDLDTYRPYLEGMIRYIVNEFPSIKPNTN